MNKGIGFFKVLDQNYETLKRFREVLKLSSEFRSESSEQIIGLQFKKKKTVSETSSMVLSLIQGSADEQAKSPRDSMNFPAGGQGEVKALMNFSL